MNGETMMDTLSNYIPIITGLLSMACMALGWFANQIWNALKKNEADLAAHRLAVAENYVRHDRLQEIMRPVNSALSDIQIMLAKRTDK